jgi:hypothetical protein
VCPAGPGEFSGRTIRTVPAGRLAQLWDADLALAEAQERTCWHEAMARSVFSSEQLQVRG